MKKIQSILVLTLALAVCLVSLSSCELGDMLSGFHIDFNNDGICDICQADLKAPVEDPCTEHVDADNNGKCDKCDATVEVTPPACTEHVDADSNGKCDNCDATVEVTPPACTEHKDENLDGKCDNCEATVEWSLTLEEPETAVLYETKTLQLNATLAPLTHALTWTSSDESVATVADGLVTAVKAGTVTIKVALTETIYDEVELTVKAPIISTAYNAENFVLDGIYQDNAVVKSNGKVNSFVAFAGEASEYYVASATIKLTDPDGGDTWSRVGISHFNGTDSYYGFMVSPGPNFGARKVVTMVITNGNVQWGTITDRSQCWNMHGMGALNYDSITITAVRAGDVFYAFLNGELYWVDHGVEGFENATLPVLNLGSCEAEYSNLGVQYGEEAVSTFLATADNNKFYASYGDTVIGADGSIKFTGAADSTCNLNAKDHAAYNVGTNALLPAGVSTTVEFDLTIDYFGGRDGLPALAVTLNRYDAAAAEARSLVIGQYKAGWTGWNSNGNLNEGIGSGGKEYMAGGESTRLEEGETYHVVFTRVMTAEGQDTRMFITDKNGNVLIEDQHGWRDNYSGRAVIRFLCRDVDCTITNLEIKEHTEHEDSNMNGGCDGCGHAFDWKVAIADKSVTELYETKTLELSASITPIEKPLAWTSSDETVATVDGGLVTALKAGKTTIRVSCGSYYDEFELTVKAPAINPTINPDHFTFSDLYSDDATVKSNGMVNSFAAFAGEASKFYVATATVKVTNPDGGDTWSRVGISHFNGTNSYYGFMVSPGPNFGARKVVTMIITDGGVQWGTVTDRSQIWGQHGMGALNYDSITITAVRAGDVFYAFLNGELYWVDHGMAGFENATLPVLNLGSCEAEYSKMSVQYGEESVNAFLATADNNKFYASYGDTVIGADGSIKFTGAADSTCNLNAKDHAAYNVGTNASLPAGVSGTIEFDLTIDGFGTRDSAPALAVTIVRYDEAAAEGRSLIITENKAGWTGWNVNNNLPDGIGSGGVEYTANGAATKLQAGETYHVVFTRVMTEGGQDTRMVITDKDGNTLIDHQHGWADGYTGRVAVRFLSRDLDCTITNITIK